MNPWLKLRYFEYVSKTTNYTGGGMSKAAVNRCWLCGYRSKGGRNDVQAFCCNRRGPFCNAKGNVQGGTTTKAITNV